MKALRFLLIIVCTLSLTGCASTKQADSDSSLGKDQQTLDSLYQHYSAKDSYLLRESYPFDEQHKVTYLASENQTNMPNQFSYLWPYSGTFSAVNSLLEATHDKKYQQLLEKQVLPGLEEYFDTEIAALFDADPLKETMIQKYIAMWGSNGETTECYNDVRRLMAEGKDLKTFYGFQNENKFPLRAPYGSDEVSANPNVQSAYGNGQYVFTENVWWANGTR